MSQHQLPVEEPVAPVQGQPLKLLQRMDLLQQAPQQAYQQPTQAAYQQAPYQGQPGQPYPAQPSQFEPLVVTGIGSFQP